MNATPQAQACTFPRLLGDVGGTNARFAWQSHATDALREIVSYPSDGHDSLLLLIQHHIKAHHKPRPQAIGIGIATQILGDRVKMANRDWPFSIAQIKQALGVQRMVFVNDFTALAWSLATLPKSDFVCRWRRLSSSKHTHGCAEAGYGPGVSGLLPLGTPNHWPPIGGKGGHVTPRGDNSMELAVGEWLKKRYGHA